MSYQLVLSVPESRHNKTGALFVGNPYLEELEGYRADLPGAQKEIESVPLILNTILLIGRQATKAELMRRISSVGIIHIAALADKYTGEIALPPKPGWTSRLPL